jgi:hypothetical protein
MAARPEERDAEEGRRHSAQNDASTFANDGICVSERHKNLGQDLRRIGGIMRSMVLMHTLTEARSLCVSSSAAKARTSCSASKSSPQPSFSGDFIG